MEKARRFTQDQKFAILETVKGVGIKKAAEMAGVHYTTVYEWRRQLDAWGEEAFRNYKPPSVGRGIKRITEAQEKAVVECWGRYPGFGPSQVRNQLRRQGVTISTHRSGIRGEKDGSPRNPRYCYRSLAHIFESFTTDGTEWPTGHFFP